MAGITETSAEAKDSTAVEAGKAVEVTEPATKAEATESKPLSKALRWFYGVGDFGFTLMSSVETYYFVFFLTNLAMFDPAVAALVAAIGSGVDAVLGWMYGGFINSLKPFKWGRYRSWLLVLPWLVPFLYAFEFVRISDNVLLSAVLIIFFNVTSHAAWDFPYVANLSMIAIAGKTPEERQHMASTRSMYSNASKIVFSYIVPPIALFGAATLGEANQYAVAAFATGAIFAVLYYIHFRMFKGYDKEFTAEELKNYKANKQADESRTTFGDLMRALFTNPPLIALMLSDIAKWIFNFTCAGIAVYYFTYVVFDPAMLATYIFLSNLLCVIGSYFAPFIVKILKSGRNATAVMLFLMTLVLVAARLVYTNMWAVIVLMSLAQMFYGVVYAVTPALYADTVIYAQWKTHKNAAGWISGLQLFPLKIGFVARGVVIPALLAAAGFVSGMAVEDTTLPLQEGICNGFMVVPAIICAIAAVILLAGFRLTPAKIEQYQREIEAREATE